MFTHLILILKIKKEHDSKRKCFWKDVRFLQSWFLMVPKLQDYVEGVIFYR